MTAADSAIGLCCTFFRRAAIFMGGGDLKGIEGAGDELEVSMFKPMPYAEALLSSGLRLHPLSADNAGTSLQ